MHVGGYAGGLRKSPGIGAGIAGKRLFANRILALHPSDLLGYWLKNTLLDDGDPGGAVNSAPTGSSYNGTHSGVTIGPDAGAGYLGQGSPGLYDGALDYTDIYSAALDGAFNGQLFSVLVVLKLGASDPLLDTVFRLAVDANNQFYFRMNSETELRMQYSGGGTNGAKTHTFAAKPTDFVQIGASVNLAADRARLFIGGVQSGTDLSSLGTWAGSLDSTLCVIGALVTSGSGSLPGILQHVPLWNRELTPAEFGGLAA